MIYLDYAATTPMSDEALKVYVEAGKQAYGNPSSLHDIGGRSEQILSGCREEVAAAIGGDPQGVYFTSGGTEANSLAVRSIVKAYANKGKHLITSRVEHPSVLNTFTMLEAEGFRVTYLPVDGYGQVCLKALEKAIRRDTVLVSIANANSEIGTVQPIEQIGSMLAGKDIAFHSDCVQTFGKIPLNVKNARVHSISISSHKIYGPKGVGACYIQPDVSWKSVIPGTTHENGFRPGTVDVPGIASFTTAAQEMLREMYVEKTRCALLRDRLYQGLIRLNKKIVFEGHPVKRLPHHLGLRIPGMEGQYAMLELNRYGIAVSTGTACRAGEHNPSPAMLAIGKNEQEAAEFIRITLGRFTKETDIQYTVNVFEKMLKKYFSGKRSAFEGKGVIS